MMIFFFRRTREGESNHTKISTRIEWSSFVFLDVFNTIARVRSRSASGSGGGIHFLIFDDF